MTTQPKPLVSQRAELKPCPFCKSVDTFVERADFSACYVVCNDCGARGPTRCNENDADVAAEDDGAEPGEMAARRAWNTRPAETLASLSSEGEEPWWRWQLRQYAFPDDGDAPATAALKKAARVITQMHQEKAGCSSDVQDALDMISAALATPSPSDVIEKCGEGQVEQILRRCGLHRGDVTKANQARGAIRAALAAKEGQHHGQG